MQPQKSSFLKNMEIKKTWKLWVQKIWDPFWKIVRKKYGKNLFKNTENAMRKIFI